MFTIIKPSDDSKRISQLVTSSILLWMLINFFRLPECLCKYQQNHVSGESPGRSRSLRLHTDKTDLQSAGSGLEKFCCCTWRALHHPRHVVRLSPEGWTGKKQVYLDVFEWSFSSDLAVVRANLFPAGVRRKHIRHVCGCNVFPLTSPSLEEKLLHSLWDYGCSVADAVTI